MPDKMIRDMVHAKNVNKGHQMQSQLHAAMFDLAIHMPPTQEAAKNMDTTRLWNQMKEFMIGLASDDQLQPMIG